MKTGSSLTQSQINKNIVLKMKGVHVAKNKNIVIRVLIQPV